MTTAVTRRTIKYFHGTGLAALAQLELVTTPGEANHLPYATWLGGRTENGGDDFEAVSSQLFGGRRSQWDRGNQKGARRTKSRRS